MHISPDLLNSVGLAWGLSSTRLMMMVWMLSLLMPVGAWQRPNLITLPKNGVSCPQMGCGQESHEYLYGLTFDVYTDNNPLTYVLTMAKPDTASHWLVASLANYNFQLYYRAGKTNIDMDAFSRVSWLGCMPNALGTHLQVTAAAVWAMQEATLKGPMSPIEAYSCNLCILDSVKDSPHVTCMTIDDWHQAQQSDLLFESCYC